jgi:hypothetical protein
MERVADAQALLTASRWSAAYYLTGYAVECALKSCVLAYIEQTGIIFKEKKFVDECWTHDPQILIRKANLTALLGQARSANPRLDVNVEKVALWNESARYQTWNQTQAEDLLQAAIDPTDGVLTWLKTHW